MRAWLERAARGGLALLIPTRQHVRKGLGVKKTRGGASPLCGGCRQGHAKAMHNLAVLYAAASTAGRTMQPRRSGSAGPAMAIIDSQYNLAILYARGAGIERNRGILQVVPLAAKAATRTRSQARRGRRAA